MIHDNTQALARYNNLFDNQQYSAIAECIAADLRVECDSTKVADHMNAITDVALSISGHSHYTDAAVKLATRTGSASPPSTASMPICSSTSKSMIASFC